MPQSPPLFIHHLGLQLGERRDGMCTCTLQIEPHHCNTSGVVHGGVTYTLADTAMGAAVIPGLGPGERCVTIDITIAYFKPVTGGVLECAAHVVHRGGTIANVEASVYREGVLVARASGNYAIVAPRQAAAA